MDEKRIQEVLRRCWSSRTSTKWTAQNPAAGQCAVTALVINDQFGGRILKMKIGDLWHFYNEIAGRRVDFTAEQFVGPLSYSDTPSSREDAFTDAMPDQYQVLAERYAEEIGGESCSGE
jgi:hypothetical protein